MLGKTTFVVVVVGPSLPNLIVRVNTRPATQTGVGAVRQAESELVDTLSDTILRCIL